MIAVMIEQDIYDNHEVLVRTVKAAEVAPFLCPVCRAKVLTLNHAKVTELTPVTVVNIPAALVRHSGALGQGNGHCRIKYYFAL